MSTKTNSPTQESHIDNLIHFMSPTSKQTNISKYASSSDELSSTALINIFTPHMFSLHDEKSVKLDSVF